MPLKIQLKPKERVIINGAVVEGHPENRTEIVVLNNASVMRQKHILQESDADTPVKRLYFALQMLYIDEDSRELFQQSYKKYHKDLTDTLSLPTIKVSLGLIEEAVAEAKYYDAMKVCRDLIKVEAELFKLSNPMADDDDDQE
jgi:flagellar biosynthesis repressor protein FlbT